MAGDSYPCIGDPLPVGFAQKLPPETNITWSCLFPVFWLAVGGWRTGSFFSGKTGQSAKSRWRADWVTLGMFTCAMNIPPAVLDFEAKPCRLTDSFQRFL
jgi:hypothetical protein